VLYDVLVPREFDVRGVDAAGRSRHDHAGARVRRGLLHHEVRPRDAPHGLKAQVAGARGVVLDEEEAEVLAEDAVRALDPRGALAVRGGATVPLHRLLQLAQPRHFVARYLLRRAMHALEFLDHDRLFEQVKRGRRRSLAVRALQDHQGQRGERQRRDDHARERVHLPDADEPRKVAAAGVRLWGV